ncbi:MAG: hypothetical protein V3S69_05370 [Dehalococcoidales bacterium]
MGKVFAIIIICTSLYTVYTITTVSADGIDAITAGLANHTPSE